MVAVGKVLVQQGLLRILEGARSGETIRVAHEGQDVRNLLLERRFDLVLIDPVWVATCGAKRLQAGSRRVLLVTDRDHAGEEPLPGADIACGMLSESLDSASTARLLETLIECRRPEFEPADCGACLARQTWSSGWLPLSPRELEIFRAIGAGQGPQRIAQALGLSIKTVECHREKIKYKLGLDGADALVYAAKRWCQGYSIGGM
jgi:DNA-binding NarL/FixJ family response regulator